MNQDRLSLRRNIAGRIDMNLLRRFYKEADPWLDRPKEYADVAEGLPRKLGL